MGVKQEVIADIFGRCRKSRNWTFDNELVRQICKKHGFGNPFDVTKLDNTSVFPDALIKDDYFIVHLGRGRHKFIKGIDRVYCNFPRIQEKSIIPWKYRKSLLNEFDTSESNILSVANNQRIIHDFLYEDIVASPKVYNSRRTTMTCSYNIGDELVKVERLQMEIDLTMEIAGVVTTFEGKNGFPKNFAVYQLFHPFKYYSNLRRKNRLNINKITCCYILRDKVAGNSSLRLFNYTFEDENDITSIKLLKSMQYDLLKR